MIPRVKLADTSREPPRGRKNGKQKYRAITSIEVATTLIAADNA
jgi:hypothetical protein